MRKYRPECPGAEPPYFVCPLLTSTEFEACVLRLHDPFGVNTMLADGENPLADRQASSDIDQLLAARFAELRADLADVLRAANAGVGEGDLCRLARVAINERHSWRTIMLENWLSLLGLPVDIYDPGYFLELAQAIAACAHRQEPDTIRSPAFGALTDALWRRLTSYHAGGAFPSGVGPVWFPPEKTWRRKSRPPVPREPRGPVRTARDVRRSLQPIFEWCDRLGSRSAIVYDPSEPLRDRLTPEELHQGIHCFDVADGSAVCLPSADVQIVAQQGNDGAALRTTRDSPPRGERATAPSGAKTRPGNQAISETASAGRNGAPSPAVPASERPPDDPPPTDERPLSDTERRILAHCRRKAHKGERIASHLGVSWDHTRRLLARLVRERRLRRTANGYRTV